MSEKWVVDASTLIILGKLSLFYLLTHLSDELIIPEGVATEVLKGPRNDKAKIWMKKEGKNYKKNIGPINLNIASGTWDRVKMKSFLIVIQIPDAQPLLMTKPPKNVPKRFQ